MGWMTESDDRILEVLNEADLVLPPKTIHVNLERNGVELTPRTIRRRLPKLEKAGLVDLYRESGRYYSISPKGRRYLSGDLDASEL